MNHLRPSQMPGSMILALVLPLTALVGGSNRAYGQSQEDRSLSVEAPRRVPVETHSRGPNASVDDQDRLLTHRDGAGARGLGQQKGPGVLSAMRVPVQTGWMTPNGFVSSQSAAASPGGSLSSGPPAELYVPPPAFNPLGADELTLVPRSEIFVALGQRVPTMTKPIVPRFVVDDLVNGHGKIPESLDLLGTGPGFRSVARGQFDNDASDELLGVEIDDTNSALRLFRGERDAQGGWDWVMIHTLQVPDLVGELFDVEVVLGDFDMDGRDEIALTSRRVPPGFPGFPPGLTSVLDVLDDPEAGMDVMLHFVRDQEHQGLFSIVGDFNADQIDDLVVGLEGNTTAPDIYSVRSYLGAKGAEQLSLHTGWQNISTEASQYSEQLIAGNFDGVAGDELAHVSTRGGTGSSLTTFDKLGLRLLKLEEAGNFVTIPGSFVIFDTPGYEGVWRGAMMSATKLDRFEAQKDEIAVLAPGFSQYFLRLFEWDADSSSYNREDHGTGHSAASDQDFRNVIIASGDGHSDGKEELFMALVKTPVAGSQTLSYGWLESGDGGDLVWEPDETFSLGFNSYLHAPRPILVPGDYDADGFTLRATGNTQLLTSDPIPLVLMSAAPANIDPSVMQNLNGTSTSFSESSGSSESFGVTASATFSIGIGVSVEDLTGLFGVSAKATVAGALNTTNAETSITTFSQTYMGPPEEDVILFQTILYRGYEYEILSANDEDRIGDIITLDLPLGAVELLASTDFYNSQFGPIYQLDSTLLSHTVGDPTSYRSEAQVAALVQQNVGWMHPGAATIPAAANASSGLGISLATESTTEEQREISLTDEIEFKAGGATVGASIGAGVGDIYSVTTSETTDYAASVGGVVDFNTWGYQWGMAVYQHNRPADSNNNPIEANPSERPLTVITFWTDTSIGLGY